MKGCYNGKESQPLSVEALLNSRLKLREKIEVRLMMRVNCPDLWRILFDLKREDELYLSRTRIIAPGRPQVLLPQVFPSLSMGH